MGAATDALIANLKQNKASDFNEPAVMMIALFIACLQELEAAGGSSSILVESGAAAKISAFPAAGALTGAEIIPAVQGGADVQTTLTAISTFIGGGGGSGGITATLAATENLAAGALVNLFTSGGACKMRNANATDNTKPAHGFVNAAVLSGANGAFTGASAIDTGVVGLTAGAVYYLDTSAGGLTTVAPSAGGNIIQFVGVALTATHLAFFPETNPVQL
jgi:hypothetical protein